MFDTFACAFRLKNTYRTNAILYWLRSLPGLKRLLPVSLYARPGLKRFANLLALLWEVVSAFLGKALYLGLMVFLVSGQLGRAPANTFVHLFFFLTLAGGFMNTFLFDPSRDKYYAMFLLRMDARAYTLATYFYFLFKMLAGFLPFTLLFGLASGVSLGVCLLMPLFVCAVKLCMGAFILWDCRTGERVRSENLPTALVWCAAAVLIAAAYGLPALGITLGGQLFTVFCVPALVGAVFAARYVVRFAHYRQVYRTLLDPSAFAINSSDASAQALRSTYQKKLDADLTQTSRAHGYRYFNELFMKRHSRLLTRSAKRIALVETVILGALLAACLLVPEVSQQVNELMLTFLPYFLFILYLVNRGQGITLAMFINCDHSMLTYRFYRQPKVILALFRERLKYVIAINLLPAGVIALGLPLLLFATGGTTQPLNYLALFVSILSMSVFFSVHWMVMYYLLQPYDLNLKAKSPAFSVVNMLTYVVCYVAIGKRLPTLAFGTAVTVFCILYVLAALVLAYRLAPRTFKLRS